ncbi:MAG: ABC transporter substrate-binding protein [Pseudobdellovibrionaceae bacterium]|nr:ABC transporter substrate-binding protein [Pseudobdellovibrionaceae bacterium]
MRATRSVQSILLGTAFMILSPSQRLLAVIAEPLPIGVAVSQTSNVALPGQEQVIGVRLAEEYFNSKGGVDGAKIQVLLEDSAGDEASPVNAFNALLRKNVLAIVDPRLSQEAFAADPIADKTRVLVISPSNTAKDIPQIGPFVSRVSASVAIVAPHTLETALMRNPQLKNVPVLFPPNDPFNASESQTLQKAVKADKRLRTPVEGDAAPDKTTLAAGPIIRGQPTIESHRFAQVRNGLAVEATLTFASGVGYAAAWYEADEPIQPGPSQPDGVCAFSVSNDDGQKWSPVHRRDHPTFPIGANPVIGIDAEGAVYAVCMSFARDYSAGVLELSKSTDRGATWSDWKTIVARTAGFPDKPWLTSPRAGVLHLVYTDAEVSVPPAPALPKARTYATMMTSDDGGVTWSKGKVLSESELPATSPVAGAIGPSIATSASGDVLLSWGEYNRGGIRFTTQRRHEAREPPVEVVRKVEFEGPVTQVAVSPDGSHIVILWYPAHDFGPFGIAHSRDGGRAWKVIRELRSCRLSRGRCRPPLT